MTLLFPYKTNGNDEELRYSLRSVCANLPHDNVLIVGDKPKWLKNVDHLPTVRQVPNKHADVKYKVELALRHPLLSDDFILMNDDFFVLQPLKRGPSNAYRGTIGDVIHETRAVGHIGGHYIKGMQHARSVLKDFGIDEPLSFELHTPMRFNKSKLAQIFDSFKPYFKGQKSFQFRSLYGNIELLSDGQALKLRPDVKVRSDNDYIGPKQIYLSTNDASFQGKAGKLLKKRFPEKCKYER